MIQEDSHACATLAKVQKILDGRKLDFLFIDGDHSYSGVKKDFEMYSPLAAPGALIGFHDITAANPDVGLEVSLLWNEIKKKYDTREIRARDDQEGFGIGLIEQQRF